MSVAAGRFTIAIQARTGSTRLPGKMTRPFFDGKTILELIVEELLGSFASDQIVVATSTQESDAAIAEMATGAGVRCSRGSEDDVLQRVADAVRSDDVDWVVRVCADNPFLRAHFIVDLLTECAAHPCDYASFQLPDGTPTIMSHLGLFAEVVNKKTLEKIDASATSDRHREHLTSHIIDNPELYDFGYLPIPEWLQEATFIRLTVDTLSDFEICQELYEHVVAEFGSRFTAQQLISAIHKNPQLHQQMAESIAANEKR